MSNTFARRAVILVAALMLSGCTSEPVAPQRSAAPSFDLGDAEVLETLSDARGEYQHLTIAEDAAALVFDPDIVAPCLRPDFTDDRLARAQTFASRFIVEQFFDSTAAGGEAAELQQWIEETGRALVRQERWAPVLENADHYNSTEVEGRVFDYEYTSLVTSAANDEQPATIRDGGPRVIDLDVTPDSFDCYISELGELRVRATFSTAGSFRVSDEELLDTFGVLYETETEVREVLSDEVFDGEGENLVRLNQTLTFGLAGTNTGWRIADYSYGRGSTTGSWRR